MGDALDPDLMKNCPTWLEFVVLDIMKSDNQELIELYWAYKKLCTIIVLVQGKSNGIALLEKIKNDDFPNVLAWDLVMAKKVNKSLDASTMIEMDVELDRLQFKDTLNFYNNAVSVMVKFEVRTTDCELYIES